MLTAVGVTMLLSGLKQPVSFSIDMIITFSETGNFFCHYFYRWRSHTMCHGEEIPELVGTVMQPLSPMATFLVVKGHLHVRLAVQAP